MNPDQNPVLPDPEKPDILGADSSSLKSNLEVSATPVKSDIFSLLAGLWQKIHRPVMIVFIVLIVVCIGLGALGGPYLFPLLLFAGAVALFAGIGWIVSSIWIKVSGDKSPRIKVKVFVITVAVLVLPSWVILPTISGAWGRLSKKSAEKDYKSCMTDHTKPDSPKILPGTTDEQVIARFWDYYSECEHLRPDGFYFYPQ